MQNTLKSASALTLVVIHDVVVPKTCSEILNRVRNMFTAKTYGYAYGKEPSGTAALES